MSGFDIHAPRMTAKLIGGAGTGKTGELMRMIEKVAGAGVEAHEIGFVSFTRAARAEAAKRAAVVLGTTENRLTQTGWFKTIHSICVNCIQCDTKTIITDDKDGSEWMQKVFGTADVASPNDGLQDLACYEVGGGAGEATALRLWAVARNRLASLSDVWEQENDYNRTLPTLADCVAAVKKYERAKWEDGRVDFTDILAKFSGWRFKAEDEPEMVHAEGRCPELLVWFHDEFQDVSQLLYSCFKRLSEADSVKWVYLASDPFQALYSWAGADHRIFLDYEADKTRTMPQSWRCPQSIMELGERALSHCSDYFDRGIAPRAGCAGVVDIATSMGDAGIDPRQSWLLLARTNNHASRIATWLKQQGIPWAPTAGNGGWARPAKNHSWWALAELAAGREISGTDWSRAMELLPAKVDNLAILDRGTKVRFESREYAAAAGTATVSSLGLWGGAETLRQRLSNGTWPELTDDPGATREWLQAVETYGHESVVEPKVRVGTVHSVKGREADNVLLLSSITPQVQRAAGASQGVADEETRVTYVGITRARERLVVLRENRAQKMGQEMPALLSALGLQ